VTTRTSRPKQISRRSPNPEDQAETNTKENHIMTTPTYWPIRATTKPTDWMTIVTPALEAR